MWLSLKPASKRFVRSCLPISLAIGGCVQFHAKPLSAEMGAVNLAGRSLFVCSGRQLNGIRARAKISTRNWCVFELHVLAYHIGETLT
jgi:hypothetical protein